jgi:hypothetical protein
MSISAGYTIAEITAYVREYLELPRGMKSGWLAEKPFTAAQLRRWRVAYLAGDLERGLVPRPGALQGDALARVRDAEQRLATERERHAAELARRDEQIAMLEAGNLALGKAIGRLQTMPAQAPDPATHSMGTESRK